jgi:hypothetical protein
MLWSKADSLACGVCTGSTVSTICGTNLDEKVSALDPVDVLNHKIGIAACELSWTVHNFVQAHS